MTDLPTLRLSYLQDKGIDPDTIPGRACARGDWDHAPALAQHIEEARLKALPEVVDE